MSSILTFNIFNQKHNKEQLLIDKLKDNNILEIPDLIFTQEHNKLFLESQNSIYKEFYNYGNGCETIGLFYNSKSVLNPDEEINIIANIASYSQDYDDTLFPMSRYGFVIDFRGVKIANLHLEGGRMSDVILANKNLIPSLLKYKNSLLLSAARYKPDIILGDFNSQYYINDIEILCNTNEYITNKHNYNSGLYLDFKNPIDEQRFNKFKSYYESNIVMRPIENITESKMLLDFNNNTHTYIKNLDYTFNCDNIESVNSSSRGNSVVDVIYTKNSNTLFKKVKSKIIDCGKPDAGYLYGNLSDHNPIYLKY